MLQYLTANELAALKLAGQDDQVWVGGIAAVNRLRLACLDPNSKDAVPAAAGRLTNNLTDT